MKKCREIDHCVRYLNTPWRGCRPRNWRTWAYPVIGQPAGPARAAADSEISPAAGPLFALILTFSPKEKESAFEPEISVRSGDTSHGVILSRTDGEGPRPFRRRYSRTLCNQPTPAGSLSRCGGRGMTGFVPYRERFVGAMRGDLLLAGSEKYYLAIGEAVGRTLGVESSVSKDRPRKSSSTLTRSLAGNRQVTSASRPWNGPSAIRTACPT
jgi:hypothetical protein